MAVPEQLERRHTGSVSTQQALRPLLVDLSHAAAAPQVAARSVTVSPRRRVLDEPRRVINRVGIWSIGERIDWFADDRDTLVRWREHVHGQDIELGIAEVNLVELLGELGATWSRRRRSAAVGPHGLPDQP